MPCPTFFVFPDGVPNAQTQATSCGTVKLAKDHCDPAYAPIKLPYDIESSTENR